jgi:trans-aconitate 2-methyltransferase
MGTPDWDARTYHAVSEPQWRWGQEVLARLALVGDEVVLDAGCGTGRLTSLLAARVPRGHVIALDASPAMIAVARETLASQGERVSYVTADLAALELVARADVVFSNATFHWVRDHALMFVGLHRALRPGGRLHAQCGGEGNLEAFHALVLRVAARGPWARHLAGMGEPWYFAPVDATRERLLAAGYSAVDVHLTPAPTRFADASAFAAFIENVVLRHHLARLPEELREGLLREVTHETLRERGAYELDYVRLNLGATRA